ncbi:MAG: response regulator [Clostridiales bacterium]|nr:response regulator [Clostridiales bacterium]
MKESAILLETGTNELEILEFYIAGNSFGINVSKITELMQAQEVQHMPRSNPYIEGVFQPRKEVYTIIDLAKYLGMPASENPEKDIYIITNFNKMSVAFHVHSVENIYRISWKDIEKPNSIIYGGTEGIVTGIAKTDDRMISILDFEKITYDIGPETGINICEVKAYSGTERANTPILVAEDSALLRKMLLESLHTAGYTNIIMTTNGQEAWNVLEGFKAQVEELPKYVSCVITDIEMPQMDGHRLTKMIRSDPQLRTLPVIIFSSLIEENMRLKGIEVGADAQLSKPDIGNLVDTLTEVLQAASENAPREEPQDVSEDTPTEEPQDVSEDTPTEEPQDVSEDAPTEEPQAASENAPTEELRDASESAPMEELRDASESAPTEELRDASESAPTEELRDASENAPTEEPQDVSEDTPAEELQTASENVPIEEQNESTN